MSDGWKEVLDEAAGLLEPLMVTLRKAIGYKPKEKAEVPEEAEGGEETEAEAEESCP